jgi:hypothetical protein
MDVYRVIHTALVKVTADPYRAGSLSEVDLSGHSPRYLAYKRRHFHNKLSPPENSATLPAYLMNHSPFNTLQVFNPTSGEEGVSIQSLKLDGTETFDLVGIEGGVRPR